MTLYFDIGANIGLWAIANLNVNKSNTDIKIISVEASEKTYIKLVDTCKKYKNITCLNYAVCDNNNEDVTFYHCTSADTLSTLNKEWLTSPNSRFYNYKYNEIKCPSITIDKLIEKYGIPQLIKMDVEAGEYNCIKSLTQKAQTLCFEWSSESNDISFNCLDHLYNLGYRKYYIQYKDEYTFRPTTYHTIDEIKLELNNTIPRNHFGMIWCD